jgi:hypothetical protein
MSERHALRGLFVTAAEDNGAWPQLEASTAAIL